MTRKAAFTMAVLVLLSGTGAVLLLQESSPQKASAMTGVPVPAAPQRRLAVESPAVSAAGKAVPGATELEPGNELKNLRRELASAKVELEKLSRPLHGDIASSTVSATVKNGESLVTGGYKTRDGNYELTFLTPRSVRLKDGREAVEVSAQIVTLGQEAIAGTGLETMATNARNTIQHAEAWSHKEVENTLTAIREKPGQEYLSPHVTSGLSEPFTIQVGTGSGPAYSLEASVGRDARGDWTIQSRIERDEGAPPPETP